MIDISMCDVAQMLYDGTVQRFVQQLREKNLTVSRRKLRPDG